MPSIRSAWCVAGWRGAVPLAARWLAASPVWWSRSPRRADRLVAVACGCGSVPSICSAGWVASWRDAVPLAVRGLAASPVWWSRSPRRADRLVVRGLRLRVGAVDLLRRMGGQLARCRPAGDARACGFAGGAVDHPGGLINLWRIDSSPSWPVPEFSRRWCRRYCSAGSVAGCFVLTDSLRFRMRFAAFCCAL